MRDRYWRPRRFVEHLVFWPLLIAAGFVLHRVLRFGIDNAGMPALNSIDNSLRAALGHTAGAVMFLVLLFGVPAATYWLMWGRSARKQASGPRDPAQPE